MTMVSEKKKRGKRHAHDLAEHRRKEEPIQEPGERQRQKLDTRERIKSAAWSLFTSEGYQATTTKAVARVAGVAAGTVFLHASDKADLLFLVMHDRLARVVDRQMATVPRDKGLVDQMMHVFGGLFAFYEKNQGLARELVRALPGAPGQNAAQMHALTFAFQHQLAQLVRDAQKAGEVSAQVPPLLAAANLFVLYFGALQGWLNGFTTLEAALDPGLRMALGLQMDGLRAR
jgi:TetR/AcrR family transcriptional regulator, cholesterol catabolism regulator